MKPLPVLSALVLAFGLSLSFSAPAFAAGGKASTQHAQAKAAKLEADQAAEKKAEARAEQIKAGEKPAEEKTKTWNHRAVRHKQTMPAAPTQPVTGN